MSFLKKIKTGIKDKSLRIIYQFFGESFKLINLKGDLLTTHFDGMSASNDNNQFYTFEMMGIDF